jgi:hypothetical protein
MNTCLICKSEARQLFLGTVLKKNNVAYYKCEHCGFIQTESPYWLQESYSKAIASLDIGLVSRNLYLLPIIEKILVENFDYTKKFIDFAGGYGLFVRLMRDKGFDFYRQDKYCQNIFAEYFDISDIGSNKFEALTAFEVFEHLQNPIEDIKKMFTLSDTIIFSTELQPLTPISNVNDWWYFSPETGQHISFYTYKTLEVIAGHFNCHIYSNRHNLHILSPKKFTKNPFDGSIPLRRKVVLKINSYLNRLFDNTKKINLQGKLQSDYEYVKNIINK